MWSVYDTFLLLTGVVCIVAAFLPVPGTPPRVRAAIGLVGAGIVALSLITGSLTSFRYPSITFAAPFLAAAFCIATLLGGYRRSRQSASNSGSAQPAFDPQGDAATSTTKLVEGNGENRTSLRIVWSLVAVGIVIAWAPWQDLYGQPLAYAAYRVFGYGMAIGAVVLLRESVRTTLTASAILGAACIFDLLNAWGIFGVVPWLWTIPYGIVVLGWFVARRRRALTFLIAVAVPVLVVLWELAGGSDPGGIAIMVGACWLGVALGKFTRPKWSVESGVEESGGWSAGGGRSLPHPSEWLSAAVAVLRASPSVFATYVFVSCLLVVLIHFAEGGVSGVGYAVAGIAYIGALFVVGDSFRRSAASAAGVALVCVLPALLGYIAPDQFRAAVGSLAFLGLGVVVLAWQITMRHFPPYYLFSAVVVLAAFTASVALGYVMFALPFPVNAPLIQSVVSAAAVVSGCWLSSGLSARNLRRSSAPIGLGHAAVEGGA
jgi:hypothetical protein